MAKILHGFNSLVELSDYKTNNPSKMPKATLGLFICNNMKNKVFRSILF